MNLLFYYGRPILPNDGGIACISLSLIKLLETHGNRAFALAKADDGKGVFLKNQMILPYAADILCDENIKFTEHILREHKIEIVINQQPIDDSAEKFWIKVRNSTGVKILSFFHNPITLSAKNYTRTNQNRIEDKFGVYGFKLLSSKLMSRLLLRAYILKNRKRYRTIVENSDLVAVLCDGMKTELVEMIGYTPNNVSVIPNFTTKIPQYIKTEKKDNLILWCGQVNFNVKRLDMMLKIWEVLQNKLPYWKLAILGDGPDLNNAKRMAEEMKLTNISFEGRVPPDKYYEKAKFVVITSSYESFSLVTLESMSYSVIPVGFDTFPAAKFMLKSLHEKLFVKAYDIETMCNTINSLINDNILYRSLQKQVYKLSQELDSCHIGLIWLKELQKLITNEG